MLYEGLIERDVDAFAADTRELADEELWVAVARFAVLAYSPSQHSKRAVMAVRAAHDVRGDRYRDLILECARYAADSRQPWSEPPIFEDLEVPSADELKPKVTGDAALLLDTALALEPLLGEKGRPALLRMPVMELEANPAEPALTESLDALIARAIAEKGSIDSVRSVFIATVSLPLQRDAPPLKPYPLARDYAQTLIAHCMVRRLPPSADAAGFLAAVHHNLEHGDSYADWSFA